MSLCSTFAPPQRPQPPPSGGAPGPQGPCPPGPGPPRSPPPGRAAGAEPRGRGGAGAAWPGAAAGAARTPEGDPTAPGKVLISAPTLADPPAPHPQAPCGETEARGAPRAARGLRASPTRRHPALGGLGTPPTPPGSGTTATPAPRPVLLRGPRAGGCRRPSATPRSPRELRGGSEPAGPGDSRHGDGTPAPPPHPRTPRRSHTPSRALRAAPGPGALGAPLPPTPRGRIRIGSGAEPVQVWSCPGSSDRGSAPAAGPWGRRGRHRAGERGHVWGTRRHPPGVVTFGDIRVSPPRCHPSGVTHPASPIRRHPPGVTHPASLTRCHPSGVTHPVSPTRCHPPGVTHPVSPTPRHSPGVTHSVSPIRRHPPGVTHTVSPIRCHPHSVTHPVSSIRCPHPVSPTRCPHSPAPAGGTRAHPPPWAPSRWVWACPTSPLSPRWGPRGVSVVSPARWQCWAGGHPGATPLSPGAVGSGLSVRRRQRLWWLLLLAWLGLGTAQDLALGTPARVPEPPAPARPRGTWGSWGPWSSCSSSCGDGVALRSRRCQRSSEEQPCSGDPRQYRLCQLQGCPSGSVPFRAMQCSLYDNRPVLGTSARYRWVPFHGAPNLCDLNCLAEGHNFYYSFGRVLDGTRCGPGSPDLCVGGRCLSVGCDGILGSGARPDACGHCGSGQGSCVLVHRLFQGADPSSGYFGYVNVTKIPAGATNIKVSDKSRNYLALMASDGRYVLNGDWAIAWPGPYEAAGTLLTYSRAPDGTESLEAPGPTLEDLHVLVLLQEPNPGIEYQFWLPRGHPQLGRGDSSPLRQPQPRGAGSPPPPEPPEPPVPPEPPGTAPPAQPGGSATEPPPRSPPGWSQDGIGTGRCGRCRTPKGRSQRIRHFCQSDFVFHGRIVARRVVGQETRYEVEVKAPYRQRFPLVAREYLWVPNTCGCPALRHGGDYLLMARRHVNHEHTLNRILLQDDGYARPWTPREARLVREAARHCPHPRPP